MKEGTIKVAVDAVVFTIKNDDLRVLLIKRKYDPFKDKYALPGGFVNEDENLLDAAKRELEEETGVKDIFLKQLDTYGKVGRDPRGRVISIVFLAIIRPEQNLKIHDETLKAEWHSIASLPELGFDHKIILKDALEHLKFDIQTTNIGYQILPKKFTLTEMQNLYEIVLGRKLDKRNFRKRIRELEILKETNETKMDGPHRPARLYHFVRNVYSPIKDKIHVFLK